MHICTNTHTDCSCEEPLYYPEHSTIYFPLTLRMKQKYTDYLPLITLTSLTKPPNFLMELTQMRLLLL